MLAISFAPPGLTEGVDDGPPQLTLWATVFRPSADGLFRDR